MTGRWHRILAAVWAVSIIPSILWWSHSVLWVIVASIYANVVSHWGAAEASNAKDAAENPPSPE